MASSSPATDEYVLYVAQVERQTGEWVFVGGYAGEVVTEARASLTFAPDRGLSRALVQEDEAIRGDLKELGFLTRDPRKKERKKYGRKGARRRFQFSKR